MQTHKQIWQWNNAEMCKNETFHIHVKGEHGYSPKYPEHVFSVIGLNLCRHGHNHKMRQITKCDGKDSWIVAICDCHILCRFKMQLLRFMSVVQEGILLSTGNMYTSTSDTINKVSFVNRLWDLKLIYIHTIDITVKLRQNGQKWNFSYSCQKWTWVLSQVPRTRFQCYWTKFVPSRPWSQNATNQKMRRQGFLNCRNLWLSHFVTVQNATYQIHVRSARVYTPQCRKHVHIDVGVYQ